MKSCIKCGSIKGRWYSGPICRKCYFTDYKSKNADKIKRANKAYLNNLPKEVKKQREEKYQLKYHYGITPEKYAEMLKAQSMACAICFEPFGFKKPMIDHNHKTGKVRGLLCRPCNTGLGMLKETPENFISALNYIDSRGRGV